MNYLDLSDEELLAQCDWYASRASGPGGQKRNKTSSAIRLHHRPTGITVIANESRLQGENRRHALARLRHALALAVRNEVEISSFTVPEAVHVQKTRGRLAVNPDNPRYLPIIALVLDLLATCRGQVSAVADLLGITTSNLITLLHHDPKLWMTAQEMRRRYGLPPLKK